MHFLLYWFFVLSSGVGLFVLDWAGPLRGGRGVQIIQRGGGEGSPNNLWAPGAGRAHPAQPAGLSHGLPGGSLSTLPPSGPLNGAGLRGRGGGGFTPTGARCPFRAARGVIGPPRGSLGPQGSGRPRSPAPTWSAALGKGSSGSPSACATSAASCAWSSRPPGSSARSCTGPSAAGGAPGVRVRRPARAPLRGAAGPGHVENCPLQLKSFWLAGSLSLAAA